MLLSSLILLFLPILEAAVHPKSQKCLPSGNETPINQALSKGGKSAVVTLCPGSVHNLQSSIIFTAARQTLTTEGNPKGRERAMLIVEGPEQAVAIQADCRDCSFATIRSLVVDGNRPQLLRVPGGGALLALGNGEGQTVRDCRLYEPRGWSSLHFREGDRKQCRKAHVVDNDIGPCGEEWDDDYDGLVETPTPPWGNPRADGISLACQDSLVERNIVTDTTDGAIVIFGSAGSEVRENTVYSRTRVVLGGINLVDYDPWKGDYFGVTVHHNELHALGRYFKVGIVVGPSSWSDDTETTVHSASITDNTLHGEKFGYGIVVSSATEFTVLRNQVDKSARFDGVKGPRCPHAPENGKPTAFLINRGSARGTFQEGFVNGEVQHIICINPPDENGRSYKAWRLRDDPLASAAKAVIDPEIPLSGSPFDARLAEALVNYQMRLLGAMDGINHKIERVNRPEQEDDSLNPDSRGRTGISQVDQMVEKLDLLEGGDKRLQAELYGVQAEFEAMSGRVKRGIAENRPVIEDIFRSVGTLRGVKPSGGRQKVHERDAEPDDIHVASDVVVLGPLTLVFGSGVVIAAALSVIRRWRAQRGGTNKGRKIF